MKSERAQIRENFRYAANDYFNAITGGHTEEEKASRTRALARHALKLHLFELGFRAGKRGAKP